MDTRILIGTTGGLWQWRGEAIEPVSGFARPRITALALRDDDPPRLADVPEHVVLDQDVRARSLECRLSQPRMLMPDAACRTTLSMNWTFSTTDQGLAPSWLRGVKRIAIAGLGGVQRGLKIAPGRHVNRGR